MQPTSVAEAIFSSFELLKIGKLFVFTQYTGQAVIQV